MRGLSRDLRTLSAHLGQENRARTATLSAPVLARWRVTYQYACDTMTYTHGEATPGALVAWMATMFRGMSGVHVVRIWEAR